MNLSYNTLQFYLDHGIGHIVISQPPGNMMTVEFFHELSDVAERMKAMNGLGAIVISGKGRHFSSGAKLDELLGLLGTNGHGNDSKMTRFLEKNFQTFLYFEKVNIPVISAIRGACLGSALEFALFSHFRFCGEDAVFGLPETTFNLLPGIGGVSRIARLAGRSRAMELVLQGNTFPAEEALRLNIVDSILPRKSVVDTALEFAGTVMKEYRKGKEKLYLKRLSRITS